MLLSVVILSYKVPWFLQLCLQSVERALVGIESEIIVIDNASEDESLKMLSDFFPNVKVISNTQNVGFAKANNQAVREAKGEYVCILNPDTVIPENCFKELLAFAEKKENLGAIGIRLIDGTGNFLPESKRNLPTLKISIQKVLGESSKYYANQLAQDEIGEVPVLVGAFMLMKKEVYLDLGGFDEDYFMYGEDIDLSYRLSQNGYTNYYYGKLIALHFKGESSIKNRIYARQFYGAMHIFNKKHFSKGTIVDCLIYAILNMLAETYNSSETAKDDTINISQVFLVTDAQEDTDSIKIEFKIPIRFLSLEALKTQTIENALIIFDLKTLSITEILSAMNLLKNNQNTFRIRPSNCNFIAGSDTSTKRGEIRFW